jgi:hypothetical protein
MPPDSHLDKVRGFVEFLLLNGSEAEGVMRRRLSARSYSFLSIQ